MLNLKGAEMQGNLTTSQFINRPLKWPTVSLVIVGLENMSPTIYLRHLYDVGAKLERAASPTIIINVSCSGEKNDFILWLQNGMQNYSTGSCNSIAIYQRPQQLLKAASGRLKDILFAQKRGLVPCA